jgi:hypothetical protein
MRNKILNKTLVLGIVILFVGAVVIPSISSASNQSQQKDANSGRASFNPFLEGWKYRKSVPVKHEMVAGPLNYFPVLVSYTDVDLLEKAQIDGDDIIFMDDKGKANQLFHEIEYYDGFTGELVAWVNIPYLSPTEDTIFYMYYGNPDSTAQEQPWGVWDSDYIHVGHLGDSLDDSAGSSYGTDYGTSVVSGKIGKGRDFEQSEHDYISLGDMALPGDGSLATMTWEGWVKPESIPTYLMNKYNSQGPTDYRSYAINIDPVGKWNNHAYQANGVSTYSKTSNIYATVGEWIYLVSTWDLGIRSSDIVPYINGQMVSDNQESSNADYICNTPISDDLGRNRPETGTKYGDAVIDEVRWSRIIRSDEWILTSFNNMNDPKGFSNICSEVINYRTFTNRPLLSFLQNHPNLFPLLQSLLIHRFGL